MQTTAQSLGVLLKSARDIMRKDKGLNGPFVRAKHREDWNIPDPKELPPEEFRRIRDLIETKVKELLAKLDSQT